MQTHAVRGDYLTYLWLTHVAQSCIAFSNTSFNPKATSTLLAIPSEVATHMGR